MVNPQKLVTGSFFSQSDLPNIELVVMEDGKKLFAPTNDSPEQELGKAFCAFLNQTQAWLVKESHICANSEDAEFLDKEHYHFIINVQDNLNLTDINGPLDAHLSMQKVITIKRLSKYYLRQIEDEEMDNKGCNDNEFSEYMIQMAQC